MVMVLRLPDKLSMMAVIQARTLICMILPSLKTTPRFILLQHLDGCEDIDGKKKDQGDPERNGVSIGITILLFLRHGKKSACFLLQPRHVTYLQVRLIPRLHAPAFGAFYFALSINVS